MNKNSSKPLKYVPVVLCMCLLALLPSCDFWHKNDEDDSCGILSETASLQFAFDDDVFLGTFKKEDTLSIAIIDLETDDSVNQEGDFSLRTTLSVDVTKDEYAGWFISWGENDIDSANLKLTRNMSEYEAGALTFWIRSPIDLEVAIQFVNADEVLETSSILLSRVATFRADDIWRQVRIPLTAFGTTSPETGSSPLDLTRVKTLVLFNSSIFTGGTSGVPVDFWVDDVRWELEI